MPVPDWEHLTVRLDAASLAPQGVWYNSHRNIEGEWRPAAKVPRDPHTGRLVAFVAKDGHGLYPKVGAGRDTREGYRAGAACGREEGV